MDNKTLAPKLLQRLVDWLRTTVGLHFTDRNIQELIRRMTAAMADFGFNDLQTFVYWLIARSPTQPQVEVLASHLTIGETYFFREIRALEILETALLPSLIDARRRAEKCLRFWSAGCSTGEEPYSIAILLDRLLPDWQDWKVTILATDINPVALRKAREGLYSEWSFRSAPPWLKERYFEQAHKGRYLLKREIRERVSFSYLNLSENRYPAIQNHTHAIDFIFCRNVLMYFAPAQIRAMTERFHRTLQDGGYLIVSPVETTLLADSPFTPLRFQDWTLYQKIAQPGNPLSISSLSKSQAPRHQGEQRSAQPGSPVRRASLSRKKMEPRHIGIHSPRRLMGAATIEERAGVGIPPDPLKEEGLEEQRRQTPEETAALAKALANQGRLDEALRWCEEAIAADKCNPGLYYLQATILTEQDRIEDAGVSLKKALYLDSHFVLAHFALVHLARRAGKAAEARKHLNHVREILAGYMPDDTLPESEGVTVAHLTQLISAIQLENDG